MSNGQPSSYVHCPTRVEACQWTGKNALVIQQWLAPIAFHELDPEDAEEPEQTAELFVSANSVWVPLVTGEWILVDSLGAYPCKNDIFLASYLRAQ
jgi:hypothetical protein